MDSMDLKVLLSPQFHVDFDDLLQKEGLTVFDTPELGLFYMAEVEKGEQSDQITFISHALIITPELDDFIALCTALLGNDMGGRGVITETDNFLLNLKCFSRIWHGLSIGTSHDDELDLDLLKIKITINHD